MQRQFGSMAVVADAYRQELLADAARVRPKTPSGSGHRRSLVGLSPWRRLVGTALVRAGERLQGARAIPPERPSAAAPA